MEKVVLISNNIVISEAPKEITLFCHSPRSKIGKETSEIAKS
jgi:hypothetical protein